MDYILDFEKPVSLLESQIRELKEASPELEIGSEIKALETKVEKLISEIYSKLSPWQRVQLSRHPMRPHSIDYINTMIDEFHELSGDRRFADDKSIIAGFGKLGDRKIAVIGIEKGRKTKEKIERNFGMPNPEGYRKALRIMEMASRFKLPILTLVDTPGAYPGIGAEERGQSQAIAENLEEMFDIDTPIISLIIGEGGSGGALGIAVADHVAMMEYSIYSVISPESCASILWADPSKAEQAANALQLVPDKALELKIIDSIVSEPRGGIHRFPKQGMEQVKKDILATFSQLEKNDTEALKQKRFEKFRKIGNSTLLGEK